MGVAGAALASARRGRQAVRAKRAPPRGSPGPSNPPNAETSEWFQRQSVDDVKNDYFSQGHDPSGVSSPSRRLTRLPAPSVAAAFVGSRGIAAKALEVTLLTGLRTGEVIGAQWSEIDHLDPSSGTPQGP
jgi:hypothetical protein